MHPLPADGPDRPVPAARSRRAAKPHAVEALLRDLGSSLRRGHELARPVTMGPATGLHAIDRLLGGGFPCGHLSEITGPTSAGRTSLAQGLLVRTTRRGELAALVDPADAFDPPSAIRAGVALERVLWARAPALKPALRCTQRLLETRGFSLVLLDLAHCEDPIAQASWIRFARLAAENRKTLVLLSRKRLAGTHATLTLGLQATRARFVGSPSLLHVLEGEACVLRHRQMPFESQAPARFTRFPTA